MGRHLYKHTVRTLNLYLTKRPKQTQSTGKDEHVQKGRKRQTRKRHVFKENLAGNGQIVLSGEKPCCQQLLPEPNTNRVKEKKRNEHN